MLTDASTLFDLDTAFTVMVNAYEVMDDLGFPADNEQRRIAWASIDHLLVAEDDIVYNQPCVFPIWDNGLAAEQLRDEPGDWQIQRPNLPCGGWAFQLGNSYYPDLDDTALAVHVLLQAGDSAFAGNIEHADAWIAGMQSSNGAFHVDNTCHYLNHIPFADHDAMINPPTGDVSGRCLMLLGRLVDQPPEYRAIIDRCSTL